MLKVYRTQTSDAPEVPDYVIRDGRFYRTVHHPAGWSDAADFEIRNDGKVYALTETGTPCPSAPVFEFRELTLYRTVDHPSGAGIRPDYYICD